MAQIPTPPRTPPSQQHIPIDIWWHVANATASWGDVFRLSRVNKAIDDLLLHRRALIDAQSQCQRLVPTVARGNMLDAAIAKGEPISRIKRIVHAYHSVSRGLVECPPTTTFWEPPLYAAVRQDRSDVVDLLLQFGCGINIRWSGQWNDCFWYAHEQCYSVEEGMHTKRRCHNALCVAREVGNAKMARYLLGKGIEDLLAADSDGRHLTLCYKSIE